VSSLNNKYDLKNKARNMRTTLFILTAFVLSLTSLAQEPVHVVNYKKFPGLALTPPMGWNSWNKFACNVDENMIRQMADAMVSNGMRDAGYQYINIDDCWHGTRDSLGFIHPDAKRFPSGMKALADYVHSKGLKLGIYSDAGAQTCGGRPGSRGYEYQDAMAYASWGIDYLKYDWCNTEGLKAEGAYKTITAALRNAGRPIVLSICEWGTDVPWTWGQSVGHLWRTTGDIYDCFDCIKDHGTWKSWGVMAILDKQEGLRQYAGPGHWNDPDMLEVGNGGLSVNENRAHFSLWSMIAAPLIAGNDLRNMTPETRAVLTNKEVIAVNQDSLGVQGFKYASRDSVEIWMKPLKNEAWAVCFLNRSATPKPLTFDWQKEVVTDTLSRRTLDAGGSTYALRDLWLKKDAGDTKKPVKTTVPAHDVLMFRLTRR
jgi:alpha-galactosidase